jgi:hypothetical protein
MPLYLIGLTRPALAVLACAIVAYDRVHAGLPPSDRLPALKLLLTVALIILTIALTNDPALIARLLMNH